MGGYWSIILDADATAPSIVRLANLGYLLQLAVLASTGWAFSPREPAAVFC